MLEKDCSGEAICTDEVDKRLDQAMLLAAGSTGGGSSQEKQGEN